jgi:hypothetical protein
MRTVFLLTTGIFFAVQPAAAQQPTQQATPQDKVVCKRQIDADTGSHFSSSRRVCMKASDWKQLDEETQRALTKISNRGGISPVPVQGMGSTPQ